MNIKKINKRKIRFNVIDLIIIIIVLLVAVFLIKAYVSGGSSAEQKDKVSLQYVIESDIISEDFADNVAIDDTVYDRATGRAVGRVVSCDVRSAVHTGISEGGVQTVSEIAGYRVLYITVEVTADSTLGGYSVNNVPISAGRDYELMLKNLYCTGSCISVEVTG